jgi:hypothetical protein
MITSRIALGQNLTRSQPLVEAIYSSKDELLRSIQAWAEQHKYRFRTGRSKKITTTREKVLYESDRAGRPPIQDRLQDDH